MSGYYHIDPKNFKLMAKYAVGHFKRSEYDRKNILIVEGYDDQKIFERIYDSTLYPNSEIVECGELGAGNKKLISKCKFAIAISQELTYNTPTNCKAKSLVDKDHYYSGRRHTNPNLLVMDYRDLESTIISTNNNDSFGMSSVKKDKLAIYKFVISLVNAVAFSLVADMAYKSHTSGSSEYKYKNEIDIQKGIKNYGVQNNILNNTYDVYDMLDVMFVNPYDVDLIAIMNEISCLIITQTLFDLSKLFSVDVKNRDLIINTDYIVNCLIDDLSAIKQLLHYSRGHTLMYTLSFGDVADYIDSKNFDWNEFEKEFKTNTIVGKDIDNHLK